MSTLGTCVGVDGCKAGWCVVSRTGEAAPTIRIVDRLDGVWQSQPLAMAIDMPIGLPESGPRGCDRAARLALGPRRSSVFSPPIRPMLRAGTYAEACAIGRAQDGRALSKQAYFIMPRIREVDALITPGDQAWCVEAHPELIFARLQGEPLATGKKTAEGRAQRRALLARAFGEHLDALVEATRRRDAAVDDVYDAAALLWCAERLARGEAAPVLDAPEQDPRGLHMNIWS